MTTSSSEGTYKFAQAWNALCNRTTTKPEDIYVVLANLLGFHPYQLSALHPEDRLKSIILNADEVPLGLLYYTSDQIKSRRHPNNRWIPVNIGKMKLSRDGTLARYGELPGMRRVEEGFLVYDRRCSSGSKITYIVIALQYVEKMVLFGFEVVMTRRYGCELTYFAPPRILAIIQRNTGKVIS